MILFLSLLFGLIWLTTIALGVFATFTFRLGYWGVLYSLSILITSIWAPYITLLLGIVLVGAGARAFMMIKGKTVADGILSAGGFVFTILGFLTLILAGLRFLL